MTSCFYPFDKKKLAPDEKGTALLRRSLVVLSVFAVILSHGQAAENVKVGDAKSKVAFRKSEVALATPPTGEAKPEEPLFVTPGTTDLEGLSEKAQTLQGEVRYAKAKLDAARKQFELQTAAGDLERAERIDQEIKDWQARYNASRAELEQVEREITAITRGEQGNPGDEIVVPGDNLEVFVNEDPSFNGIYPVRRGGYLIMPQIGRIAVAGKTLSAAEAAVKRALQSSQLKTASVLIERKQGADLENGPVIYLSGEFKQPRPWRIPAGTTPTVVNVILSSGGVTDKADLTSVRVMRIVANKGLIDVVNVAKILDGGGLTSDLTLGEGDVVTIPAGPASLVYLTGNVVRQGTFPIKLGERISAYGAILQNGGFARFADQRKVHILRALPDGTKAKLPVDIVAIKRGQRPDVQLQSNDIVVVPEKFWSF